MHKIFKRTMFLTLAVMLLMMTGCKWHNQTQPTHETLIDMPDGMGAQLGVENEDDWDEDVETDVTVSEQDPSADIRQDETSPAMPEATKPQEDKPEDTKPQDEKPLAPGSLTYQAFYAMTPDQQEAYTDSFESLSAFNKWFNEARAAYESTIPDETVSGSIDIGKLNP